MSPIFEWVAITTPLPINLILSLYLGQEEYFYYFEFLLKVTKTFTDLTLLVLNLVKKYVVKISQKLSVCFVENIFRVRP